jgi:hypothetical protein
MSTAGGAVRRVEVRPPSSRIEFGHVVRFGMVVVAGVWIFLAADSATLRDAGGGARHLLPFQALIQDRPAVEQRMFRELQEGLLEAESTRVSSGAWPTASSLAAAGIPPFAIDPTARGGPYDWRLTINGAFVNYLGVPRHAGAPAWLVLVQEPEPGAPPDPAREDEEHHRLLNGTMLHVSTWVRADARVAAGTIRAPQAEGWTQLYAVGPSLPQPNPRRGDQRAGRYDPITRQARISEVTHKAVPPSMKVITTMSHSGRCS